jgi:hypothetical protein
LQQRWGSGGFGSKDSGVVSGGNINASRISGTNTFTSSTELYNGTTKVWSNGNNNIRAYGYTTACGSSTAGIWGTGYVYQSPSWYPNEGMATFNGSTWTQIASPTWSPTYRYGATSLGSSTDALWIGGFDNANLPYDQSIRWNGSAWSAYPNPGTKSFFGAGAGTPSSGVLVGGITLYNNPYLTNAVNSFTWSTNGSTWSLQESIYNGQARLGMSGSSSSDYCYYGGTYSSMQSFTCINPTYSYNGTSVTTRANMNTARANMGSSSQGSQSSALATTGITSGFDINTFVLTNTTEAFGTTL